LTHFTKVNSTSLPVTHTTAQLFKLSTSCRYFPAFLKKKL